MPVLERKHRYRFFGERAMNDYVRGWRVFFFFFSSLLILFFRGCVGRMCLPHRAVVIYPLSNTLPFVMMVDIFGRTPPVTEWELRKDNGLRSACDGI
jgi:hypothetical protein